MRIVLLADVGGPDGYHAGDEAMLDAAIDELRQRGEVDVTVISQDPNDTASRYGVRAIPPIGFAVDGPHGEARRDEQLAGVLALARRRLVDGRPAKVERDAADDGGPRAVIDAIDAADALIVTGGGNLSSSWPAHLYERVAALSVARHCGVPAAVTSQTIGPDLRAREMALLADALDGARLVGLRERGSLCLTSTLLATSTPRRLQLDDAANLPEAAVPSFPGHERLSDGFVALTANPLGDGPRAEARLDGLATLIRRVYRRSRCPIVFLPHVGKWCGKPSGDLAVGEALRERIGGGPELILSPLLPARALASLTRRATAVVSTRYHPLVFGLAAAVPCLAIYQDQYTSVKLTGALGHAALAGWRVPIDSLLTDLPGDVFDELWSRRQELTEHLSSVTATWPSMHEAHWDEVWRAITESDPGVASERTAFGPPSDAVMPKLPGLAEVNAIAGEHLCTTAMLESGWRAARTESERSASSLEAGVAARTADLEVATEALEAASMRVDRLEARLADLDVHRASVEADNIQLLDEIRHSEQAAQAARALVAELRERLATEQTYIEALHATRTLRWTRRARDGYGRLRRLRPTQMWARRGR